MLSKVLVYRQIFDFAYNHGIVSFSLCMYVRVYVCLSVCVTAVTTGRILPKIKRVKNDGYRFGYHRMASLQNLYSETLINFLNVKILKN